MNTPIPALFVAAVLSLGAAELPAQRAASPTAVPRDFDAYVARVMRDFEVPGLAIAVVQDGRVLLAKGYGVRKLGDPAPVDDKTLFGIASNTKAFTATALGILVEEGKLRWDAPVIDYLPWFAMYDPYVTRELTIRDLLVHRSGLASAPATCCGGRRRRTTARRSPDGSASPSRPRVSAAHSPTTTCSTESRVK